MSSVSRRFPFCLGAERLSSNALYCMCIAQRHTDLKALLVSAKLVLSHLSFHPENLEHIPSQSRPPFQSHSLSSQHIYHGCKLHAWLYQAIGSHLRQHIYQVPKTLVKLWPRPSSSRCPAIGGRRVTRPSAMFPSLTIRNHRNRCFLHLANWFPCPRFPSHTAQPFVPSASANSN